MKPEQDDQALSISQRGHHWEQLPQQETDDFEELRKRGLNLGWVWRTIQRNILLITGTVTVAAATALCSGLTSPHSYEGNFQLLIEPIASEAKLTDPTVISRDDEDASERVGVNYPSLLQILQSPGLLSVVANQIQTQYPDVTYDSLRENLVVQRLGEDLRDFTNIIEVRYKAEDPKEVQFVLTEIAKRYLNYSLDNRKTSIGGGVKFIEEQLPGLQQRVNNLQAQMQSLQQQYKLTNPESEGEDVSKQLRENQNQKLETQRNLQEQRSLYMNLQKQLGLTPDQAIAASTLSQEPRYQELLGQLKKTESQIAVDSARFSEENPSLQALRQQQSNLFLLLNQEAERILGQNQSSRFGSSQILNFQDSTRLDLIKQLADTANQIQILEARNQKLAQDEAFLEQQVRQFPGVMRQYKELQRQLEIAVNTLNQLLIQREILGVQAAQKEVPWKLVSEPRIPHDAAGNLIPAPRDTIKNLAIGVIAGFVLGLGAAVIKERYHNIFYTTEDIQDALDLPILGLIPFDKTVKKPFNSSADVGLIAGTRYDHSNGSLFLEAFNYLYVNIRFLASDPPVHSLVVCSAAPGDGKTTIALHLAQAVAAMGKRVLLVDANFRTPQLHGRLGLSNRQGLSNLLSQNLAVKDVIQQSPLEDNLFVLTAGEIFPNSSKLLASTQMQYLMEQFKTAFDLVIYDTPHLLGLADANFLAAHTDGLLMVVGVRKTNRSVVMQVMDKLNTFRLPVLGIVANHTLENIKSSYGYHNRHYKQNHRVRPSTDLLDSENKSDVALRQ